MSGHFDEDLAIAQAAARSQGAQCWICPHCFDDRHHHSDAQGCERHAQDLGGRVLIGPTDV